MKCIIFVLAKRRKPIDTGFSPLFLAKKWDFYLRGRKFYITEKNFSWSLRIFLRHVGGFFGDLGGRKLKDIYFLGCIFLLLGRERRLEDARGWERMGEDARGC